MSADIERWMRDRETAERDLDARLSSVAQTPWRTAVLGNSWTAYFPADWGASPRFRRINGLVYLHAMIAGGTVGFGVTAFMLPEGYRPGTFLLYDMPGQTAGGNALFTVTIRPTGAVTIDAVFLGAAGAVTYVAINPPPFQAVT